MLKKQTQQGRLLNLIPRSFAVDS